MAVWYLPDVFGSGCVVTRMVAISTFDDDDKFLGRCHEVHHRIAALGEGEIAVLVSHGSSISAFVGEYLAQGEAVVVRAERDAKGEVKTVVVGRIAVP